MSRLEGALLALAVGALILAGLVGRRLDQWQQRADTALATAAAQRDSIVRWEATADTATAESERWKAQADSFGRIASRYRATLASLVGHTDTLAQQAPDTCRPVVAALLAARDTAVQLATVEHDGRLAADSALSADQGAETVLRQSLGLAVLRGDSLASVLRAAPGSCRLLGIPCPVLTVGAVLSPSGIQPGIALGVPIRF